MSCPLVPLSQVNSNPLADADASRPVLVNVSSFRLIIGFAMSFDATTWVEQLGFMKSFAIYAGALAIISLGMPLVYFYGKRIRKFTGGKLDAAYTKEEVVDDEENKSPTDDVVSQRVPIGKSDISWPVGAPR